MTITRGFSSWVQHWYEEQFGTPAAPFTDSRDAIDHFASTTCCFAVSRTETGQLDVYAPHGYADLFDFHVRPNPVLAPRAVYEQKTARWSGQWPKLTVDPWPESSPSSSRHPAPRGRPCHARDFGT